ncbi:MAG TPA: hypothetical protein VE569_00340 [Acidimicrobiia bacterium]|jgi:hypothetical protein|nr:hypothetical protein [Acidimicrobiia bacterium]
MEPERDEVYERIPWETLEHKSGDRQWLVYAVAGAVVLGALAYSFTRNQPPAPPVAESPVVSTVPATTDSTAAVSPPSTVVSPVVVTEADLYAVDPERLIDQAAAYAEWFAVEYISYDGTEESNAILAELLPAGVPLPEAPEGTQVFVDWARAATVTQTGPVAFAVDVVVRSLVGQDNAAFVRQRPLQVSVDIEFGDDGTPHVSQPPTVTAVETTRGQEMGLVSVPEDVVATLGVKGEVIGGRQDPEGDWQVVVMMRGIDGVKRPVTARP